VPTVTLNRAFRIRWLLPQIERLHSAWSDTDVRLDTSLNPIYIVAQHIDLGGLVAQAYGQDLWQQHAYRFGIHLRSLSRTYPACQGTRIFDCARTEKLGISMEPGTWSSEGKAPPATKYLIGARTDFT